MTLMENTVQFKPRLVLWPRGAVLFGTKVQGFGLNFAPQNSLSLAIKCLVYHFHHQRSRLVTYGDWLRIVTLKMGLSRECAYFLFVQAQNLSVLSREKKLTSWREPDLEVRADLLGLIIALALLSCGNGAEARDLVEFVKENLEAFLDCLLLCNYQLANRTIQSARCEQLPRIEKVPVEALINLDPLFEGTLKTEKQMSTTEIIPAPASILLCNALGLQQSDQISFTDLTRILRKTLQPDMFSLDDSSFSKKASEAESAARTMTSTQLAEHRKITVRHWDHLELLTKQLYRGANLRIRGTPNFKGSALFCPRALKTALIKGVESSGPIVLGPCMGVVVLQNLKDVHVSVVCDRVHVQDCHDVVLFLNCKTPPIIGRNCSQVLLAPYNVVYDGLASELRYAGMQLLPLNDNRWDEPLQLEQLQTSSEGPTKQSWDWLTLEGFYLQPTPFLTSTDTSFYKYFLYTIPQDYLDSFEERRKVAEKWLKRNPEHRLLGVSEADRSYLQRRIQSP